MKNSVLFTSAIFGIFILISCFNSTLELKELKTSFKGIQISKGIYGILVDTSGDYEPDLFVANYSLKQGDTINIRYFKGRYFVNNSVTTSPIIVYKNIQYIKGVVTEIKSTLSVDSYGGYGEFKFLADTSGDSNPEVSFSGDYRKQSIGVSINDTVYLIQDESNLKFFVKK
jgi:hypothetical protein